MLPNRRLQEPCIEVDATDSSKAFLNENSHPYSILAIEIANEHLFTTDDGLKQLQDGYAILTMRIQTGKTIPIVQPKGVALIPWCPDMIYANWISFLAGSTTTHLYPHYFFMKHETDNVKSRNKRLILQALEDIAWWPKYQLSVANLAEQANMTERQLRKLFPKFFGVKPGQLLRAMELFRHTAILLDEENKLCQHGNSRYGKSPLAKYEIENNCNFSERLKRLLGIGYRELLAGAQKEHWAAFWMRKWRESLVGSNAVEKSQFVMEFKARPP